MFLMNTNRQARDAAPQLRGPIGSALNADSIVTGG